MSRRVFRRDFIRRVAEDPALRLLFRAVFLFAPVLREFGGNMKNFCKKLIAATLLIMALTALAACGDGDKLTGTAKLVVDGETDKVYSVNLGDGGFTDADTVYDLIVYLAEEQGLTFSASSSSSAEYGYDAFITAIGPLTPSGSQYIAFYHNKQADADVSGADYAKPIEYDGTTLYYSGLGAGGVKLTNDIVVYFTMLTY